MKLVLVNGFLGSGKTTAIVQACRRLMSQGKKVAVITNDQGAQQVDSAFVKSLGITNREVSNGCFCCRYNDLDNHLQSLGAALQSDIVFAESVGSCTDLVATIAKPLGQFNPEINVAISIFADASVVSSLIEGRASFVDESVRYIYKKQLEEADLIVLSKIDLVTPEQLAEADQVLRRDFPAKQIVWQNSMTDEGINDWLKLLDQFIADKNRRSLTLDYNQYGDGEAKMAWLDRSLLIKSPLGNGEVVAREIIRSIFTRLRQEQLTIGHLKYFIETSQWCDKVSFTMANTSADFRMKGGNILELKLLMNARVQTNPDTLRMLVNTVLTKAQHDHSCTIDTQREAAFKPGFPTPTHRIA